MDYVRASRVNSNLADMLKIDLHLPSSSRTMKPQQQYPSRGKSSAIQMQNTDVQTIDLEENETNLVNPGQEIVQSFEFPSSPQFSNYHYGTATSATTMISNQNPNLLKSVNLMKKYGNERFEQSKEYSGGMRRGVGKIMTTQATRPVTAGKLVASDSSSSIKNKKHNNFFVESNNKRILFSQQQRMQNIESNKARKGSASPLLQTDKLNQKLESHWNEFLKQISKFPPKMREQLLIKRIKNDASVMSGITQQLQDLYQLLEDVYESINQRNSINMDNQPELKQSLLIKGKQIKAADGKFQNLVQSLAKEKLIDARNLTKLQSNINHLKMRKIQLETQKIQTQFEFKQLKRAFAIAEQQNDQLQAQINALMHGSIAGNNRTSPQRQIIKEGKGNKSPRRQGSPRGSSTVSSNNLKDNGRFQDILIHSKGILDKSIKNQQLTKILYEIQNSFAIIVGCQDMLILKLRADGSQFEGTFKDQKIEFSKTHRCFNKILKGIQRIFFYNDTLSDPHFSKALSKKLGLTLSNLFAFPIYNTSKKNKIDGFLIFLNKTQKQRHGVVPIPFNRSDQPLADFCSILTANLFYISQMTDKYKRQKFQKQEGLNMMDSLFNNFSFGSFMKNVQQKCAEFFKVQRANFMVCDQKRRELFR